jgi:hypothetical protein
MSERFTILDIWDDQQIFPPDEIVHDQPENEV